MSGEGNFVENKIMKNIVLFLSVGIASGLLLVNIYTSLVDARCWSSDIPNSIAAAREYFKAANPGSFFRVFSPMSQLLALLALVLFWRAAPSARIFLGSALLIYMLTDVFTFAYFYPRNELLFTKASLSDIALLKKTVSEWQAMNWVRSAVLFAGVCCSYIALYQTGRAADA
jgi:uncharacterized membrane protein